MAECSTEDMKNTIAISFLFLSVTSFAAPDSELLRRTLEIQSECQNFIRFDDERLYFGFGAYRRAFEEPRQAIPARMKVVNFLNLGSMFSLQTSDAALDVIPEGDRLYILTYTGIEEWDLVSKSRQAIHPTTSAQGPLAYHQHAMGFARYGEKVIIAHGRLGVAFFDLRQNRVTNELPLVPGQSPLESTATGVTVQGRYAYVVMDNFSLVPRGKPAFRGVVVIDMETEKVIAELDGMDPGATSISSDANHLIVSFGGFPVWVYSLQRIHASSGGRLPQPLKRVWMFPMPGHPTGVATFDSKYYYTCYRKPAAPGTGGRSAVHPASLDLGLFLTN